MTQVYRTLPGRPERPGCARRGDWRAADEPDRTRAGARPKL